MSIVCPSAGLQRSASVAANALVGVSMESVVVLSDNLRCLEGCFASNANGLNSYVSLYCISPSPLHSHRELNLVTNKMDEQEHENECTVCPADLHYVDAFEVPVSFPLDAQETMVQQGVPLVPMPQTVSQDSSTQCLKKLTSPAFTPIQGQ
jgi:hypothetical protein